MLLLLCHSGLSYVLAKSDFSGGEGFVARDASCSQTVIPTGRPGPCGPTRPMTKQIYIVERRGGLSAKIKLLYC
jgi:hypothetical protein